jgi:hypothetical protein
MATADRGLSIQTDSLTGLHWLGVALAVISGIIHLVLGVNFIAEPLGWAFLLAAIGFFAGAGAVLVDYKRRLMYLLGIPFTAGQIVAWYVLNAPDFSPPGYADKAVQIVLIVVLIVLYRREA